MSLRRLYDLAFDHVALFCVLVFLLPLGAAELLSLLAALLT